MRLLAPAKINLYLCVGRVREDGFHPLVTWMTTVGLFDTITIDPAPHGIELSCDDSSVPCEESNLVVRAARSMLEKTPEFPGQKSTGSAAGPSQGLKIHLSKRIPIGGGLGGGSSDGARTLLGLNRFWNLDQTIEQLAPLAAQLGSDVPFFLHGPSSICRGRGEIVQGIAAPRAAWAVLIFPGVPISTRRVYEIFDSLDSGKEQAGLDQPSGQEWTSLGADELLPRLINNLERAAFALAPWLGKL